jgi:HAD superfamily (subfamily IIIA) phosphatase, TIGR01668
MGKKFLPDERIVSIYDIEPGYLKDKGISNIIVDIDNTLSTWRSVKPDNKACSWIDNMKKSGFKICILSNSSNHRIIRYCSGIDVSFVINVRKPFRSSFLKAMNALGSNKNNTCVIGDQLLTDIAGGNSCGLYTILVPPIGKKEFAFTKLSRAIEKVILDRKHI